MSTIKLLLSWTEELVPFQVIFLEKPLSHSVLAKSLVWVTWPRESLGTLVANKLLSCVGDLVSLHTTWIRESLVALGAGKLFISCVGHPVNLQVFCPRENLGTLVADKMAFFSSGHLSEGKPCHTGCRLTASLLCVRDCVTSIHLT